MVLSMSVIALHGEVTPRTDWAHSAPVIPAILSIIADELMSRRESLDRRFWGVCNAPVASRTLQSLFNICTNVSIMSSCFQNSPLFQCPTHLLVSSDSQPCQGKIVSNGIAGRHPSKSICYLVSRPYVRLSSSCQSHRNGNPVHVRIQWNNKQLGSHSIPSARIHFIIPNHPSQVQVQAFALAGP